MVSLVMITQSGDISVGGIMNTFFGRFLTAALVGTVFSLALFSVVAAVAIFLL